MRVLYRDNDELVLKEVMSVIVTTGYITMESTIGDKRTLLRSHRSWDLESLEDHVIAQGAGDLVDLRAVTEPRT